MSDWKKAYDEKMLTLEEAAGKIESGDVIWLGSTISIPYALLDHIADRVDELDDVTFISSTILAPIKMYGDEKFRNKFHNISLFPNLYDRAAMKLNLVDCATIPYSYVDKAVKEVYKADTILMEVTEPDEEGYCNLGPLGCAWTPWVLQYAKKIIAVVNKDQITVRGEKWKTKVHVDQITWFSRSDHPMPAVPPNDPEPIDEEIAKHVVTMINDGDTFQIGMGGLANAVGYGLRNRKNLIAHTEIITDCIADLAREGVVDKINAAGAFGTQRLYDYFTDPKVEFFTCLDIVEPQSIAKLENFVSINATMMCDYTGQMCSEAILSSQYSSVGGQIDFIRGAALAKNGRSIVTVRSTYTDKQGNVKSNIVSQLPKGSIVTTPRGEAMYIITEYGIADLYLKPNKERIKEMIKIAHPDFRQQLREEAVALGHMAMDEFDKEW